MIDIKKLTKKDIGRRVKYAGWGKPEIGRIKSYDKRYVFVIYKNVSKRNRYRDFTSGESTHPDNLTFIEKENLKK